MKVYTVNFFEHDGDGIAEYNLYGLFDTYELAYECLKQVIEKEGHDINKLYVCPPEHRGDSILCLSPKYGDYYISEKELNKIYFQGES